MDNPEAGHLLALFLGRAIVDETLPPSFLAAVLPSLQDCSEGVNVVQSTGLLLTLFLVFLGYRIVVHSIPAKEPSGHQTNLRYTGLLVAFLLICMQVCLWPACLPCLSVRVHTHVVCSYIVDSHEAVQVS